MSVENELRTLRQAVEDLRPLRPLVDDLSRAVQALTQSHRDLSGEVDGVARNLTALVQSLEQDDKLRFKSERYEEEERNRRHTAIVDSFKALTEAVQKLHRKVSEQPKDIVDHVEQKIYDLRIERWEARKAGVQNEPPLLPPPPSAREHTGKIALPLDLSDTDEESIMPTAAQQRWLTRKGKWLWERKWHFAAWSSGAIAWGWHWFGDLIKHTVGR